LLSGRRGRPIFLIFDRRRLGVEPISRDLPVHGDTESPHVCETFRVRDKRRVRFNQRTASRAVAPDATTSAVPKATAVTSLSVIYIVTTAWNLKRMVVLAGFAA
jgi:hypothetical protein